MNRRAWYLFDIVLLCVILAYALPAAGQLQPITSPGGFDWWPLAIVVIVGLLIVGLVVWHRRFPAGQAKALAEAHAALSSVAHNAIDLAHRAVDKLETAKTAPSAAPAAADVPGQGATPANAPEVDSVPIAADPAPVPQAPTAAQLDFMASRLAEYNAARAAAGLPPLEG